MSFSKTVKEELSLLDVNKQDLLAETSAFLDLSCEIKTVKGKKIVVYKSKNPTVSIRFLKNIRALYESEVKLDILDEARLKYRKSITIKILEPVESIISEHALEGDFIGSKWLLLQTPEAKKAYLRGAFLSSGSINDPKTPNYHLEIYAKSSDKAILLQQVMNFFGLNARIIKRRNGFICYIKDAQRISDFLILVGAQNALFKYEDIRIRRDFNNSINRVINCEVANEEKVIESARKQIDDITYLKVHQIKLPKKLEMAAELRLNNPDLSLRELEERYEKVYNESISRSGLNHRFIKIRQIRIDDEERRSS